MKNRTIAALIVAAGRGLRAGAGAPKQWRPVAGQPMALWSWQALANAAPVTEIAVVLHPDDLAAGLWPQDAPARLVAGGATRQDSVRLGLEALRGRADFVLIHDAARPGLTPEVIERIADAIAPGGGAAPALEVVDALWRGTDDHVTGTADRSGLYRAQTPQGFDLAAILAAHHAHPGGAADDVEVARAAGLDVRIVPGDERLMKVTGPRDFAAMTQILAPALPRIGNGYDVHRFGPGDHVMLCGVAVPHDRGLQGHSDADVAMHTITDAIYGALAEGDIGQHFPPSDPQWKGTDSAVFLRHAVALAQEKGFEIGNMDCTIICETPKIGPHAAAMRQELSRLTGVAADRISVKATTSERLGFTGRGEGIAAQATVLLVPR